ncbi:MAG: asparagine synthase (glutamine-hydrolyzing) [Alphaproteobacteria bacterium]|nr:asparagine synthase (glutamine-hydrolyzing) [Alphaproteobacteria bacterium]
MCGIAGIMTRDGRAPSRGALDALAAALRHRGPDGEGRHVSGGVGLVHRRLAIIDLATGQQPIEGPGGTHLIANAEIYNYVELRGQMAGASFRTNSDCEPPLHLYAARGVDFAASLRGMYAIAIHDPGQGRLVLARDPFGIKPLYYVQDESGFAFASEPQALLAAGLASRTLAATARDELLQLQFTTGVGTVFAGIQRVAPGETLVVAEGRIVERRHIPALPSGAPETIDAATAQERLDRALINSVYVHQRSDVPYGMFLSGGVDSAALLALMARLNEQPVRAFTVGFGDTDAHDERAHARGVAAACRAEHVEVDFDERDFWTLLPAVAAVMDDPAADYATLPTYKLGQVAGRELKVILSGEGGDELFAGYGRYRRVTRPVWLGGRILRARGTFEGIGVLRDPSLAWRDGVVAAETHATTGGRSRVQVAQAVDCEDWLPNDLLTKVDRCLMAHGVEGRTPFLDPEVAAAAFRLPDQLKIQGGLGKWVLRAWLADHLPEAIPFTRKRGFTVPVGEWIARKGEAIGPLVARQPGIREICDASAVTALFRHGGKRHGFAAWTLLFYALWHRRHILGLAPAGDAFESLAATPA